MKILLLADIHSNWPALSVINESFDICLFAGDLVDYGTDPVPCIEWIRNNSAVAIRGNHDHAVSQRIPAKTGSRYSQLSAATRPIHWKVLRSSHIAYLGRLPVTRRITIDGRTFFLVHATPHDPLGEYLGEDQEAWQTRIAATDADFVCVGHTHRPFHLDLGRTQVINPGSVGQPRDGDPRCSYVVIEDGNIMFRRVEYDIDAMLRQMSDSGMEPETLEFAEHILRSGGNQNDEEPEEDG